MEINLLAKRNCSLIPPKTLPHEDLGFGNDEENKICAMKTLQWRK
jgi:hypothetical protein